MNSFLACAAALVMAVPQGAQGAGTIFDDFNVNEGHFTSTPATGSGSSSTIDPSSTADRVTTDSPLEGAGHQKFVLVPKPENLGGAIRLRHLSGGGSAANNVAFTTSAATDGWIGVYIKTLDALTDPNWTVQIFIEGAGGNNGSVPKTIIADGDWHLYEWDLDNTAGDADGWGSIAGILAGSAIVGDGSHTIDSIIFRNPVGPASSTFFMDFVARNDSGSVADLLLEPCLSTSGVGMIGPISTASDQAVVTGVSGAATAVTVYQDSGAGMVQVGTKTSGIVAGNNSVTVSGLVVAGHVVATQTVGGQESCLPASGLFVGGGANPSVRVALSIRETSDAGPVGAPGDTSSPNIHQLGATTASGGAPINAPVVNPSAGWQTLTFARGATEMIADSGNASGAFADGLGYGPFETVAIQVFAYRTLPNGTRIYSAGPAATTDVSHIGFFIVNWTWDAVPGAEGYRLLRNLNFGGFLDYVDVPVNSYADANTEWAPGDTVTPTSSQSGPSVQWNPSLSNTNNLPGQWGTLEAIAFCIAGNDTGPFDLYIDNLQNGATVFQDFEGAVAGTTDYGFRQPSFSGTTSGSILTVPNVGVVTNSAADTGTKSFRVRFQWSGTNATKWLRLTTSGVGNPMVNLDEPISIRMLLLPVGSSPVPPPAPSLSASLVGSDVVLDWTGAHRLQASDNVEGPYTTVPGVTAGPWINLFPELQKFFRLKD